MMQGPLKPQWVMRIGPDWACFFFPEIQALALGTLRPLSAWRAESFILNVNREGIGGMMVWPRALANS